MGRPNRGGGSIVGGCFFWRSRNCLDSRAARSGSCRTTCWNMPGAPAQIKDETRMPPVAQTLLASLASITGIMIVLWLVGTARRDVSLVDPFWGTGFVIVTAVAWWLNRPIHARGWLLMGLA